jgi:hypothetical protein
MPPVAPEPTTMTSYVERPGLTAARRLPPRGLHLLSAITCFVQSESCATMMTSLRGRLVTVLRMGAADELAQNPVALVFELALDADPDVQ